MSRTRSSRSFEPPAEASIRPMARRGVEPDRFALFRDLRRLWKEANDGGTNEDLGLWLGVPRQNVAQWSTGSGEKSPAPWWAIMRLADDLGLVVVIDGQSASLHRAT